jgi:hypothetical protein
VEVLSGPEQDPPGPQRSRLLGLNPATLEAETEHPLRFTPSRLAFAPHGGHAYALSGNAVIHLDLATGRETTLLSLPEPGIALAVSDPYLFVAQAYSGELWAVDRRRGRPARRLAAGRHPVAVALVSAT